MDRTTACTPGVAAVRLLPLLLLLGSVAVSESQLYDEVLRREVSPTEDLQLHLQLTERDDEMLVWWMTPNAVPSEVRYRLKQEDRTRDRPSRSDARVLPPGSVAGDGGDGEWMLAINATGGPYNYWYVGLPDRNVDPATGIPGYLSSKSAGPYFASRPAARTTTPVLAMASQLKAILANCKRRYCFFLDRDKIIPCRFRRLHTRGLPHRASEGAPSV